MNDVLTLENLHHAFEKGTINENHVLKGINLSLDPGDFVTIIGGNGAGKSTLLNSIAGTFSVDQGQILLNGKNITKKSVVERSKSISRVFQDPKLGTAVRLTVEENLALAMKRGKKRGFFRGVKPQDRTFFKDQLARLNLGLENRLSSEIGLLSGGQRQAITLMELTEKLITEQNLTDFMVTHDMEDAIRYGNRLIMLHQGRIVVDIQQEEKQQLTVPQLLALFKQNSGTALKDDQVLLSS